MQKVGLWACMHHRYVLLSTKTISTCLHVCCRCLGPEVVLEVLPLQLLEGVAGTSEARTWLLPALRKHVSGTQLAYWAQHLLPLAKQMAALTARASTAGQKGKAAACHALELQLWGCLQAFASWPTDAAAVYTSMAPELASAFHTREDLRGIVASVLIRLCKQSRAVAVLAASGGVAASAETVAAVKGLGLVSGAAAAVPGAGRGDDEAADDDDDNQQLQDNSDDEDVSELSQPTHSNASGYKSKSQRGSGSDADEGPDAASSAPEGYTPEVALQQLMALRSFSSKWLGLMCKIFLEVSRGCNLLR